METMVALMARARAAAGARSHRARITVSPVLASVMPSGLHQQPAHVGVPGLGDRPSARVEPVECSEGTNPTNEPSCCR